jgi:hypothetical protein
LKLGPFLVSTCTFTFRPSLSYFLPILLARGFQIYARVCKPHLLSRRWWCFLNHKLRRRVQNEASLSLVRLRNSPQPSTSCQLDTGILVWPHIVNFLAGVVFAARICVTAPVRRPTRFFRSLTRQLEITLFITLEDPKVKDAPHPHRRNRSRRIMRPTTRSSLSNDQETIHSLSSTHHVYNPSHRSNFQGECDRS